MNNSDYVINNWYKDIEIFYYLLRNCIGKEIKIKEEDHNCLSLSLRDSDYLTKYQKCKNCQKVASFLDNDILEDKDNIIIKFGSKKGEKIIFERHDYSPFEVNFDNNDKQINLYINKQINIFLDDFYQIRNIFYYQIKNKFLNLSIISTIMKTIAKAKNFPTPLKFANFYICREKINLLNFHYEVENLGDLLLNPSLVTTLSPTARKKKNNFLNSNIIEDILKQLIIFFIFYEKFYFCHNEANIEFLKINYEVNNFNFLEKEYISSIKLYILPSAFSSISMYNSKEDSWARFYNYRKENRDFNNIVENWFVDWDGVNKKNKYIFRESIDDFEKGKIMYYLLGKEADKFLYFRRHLGTPIMYQSFDLICFIVSLMKENYFYYTVKNNEKLNNLWIGLWLAEEVEDVEKDIKECKKNNFIDIFTILRKYYIRSDVLEYLKNILL